jgi:serine protease
MMLKRTILLLLLIVIVIGGMGCGKTTKKPATISGRVILGGEPATTLPNPGISSLTPPLTAQKLPLPNPNSPGKPTSLIVTCDPKLSQAVQRQSLQKLGYKIIRQLYSDPNTYVVKPINLTNLEISYQASLNAGFVRAVEYNFPVTQMATIPNDTLYQTKQWDMMVTKFNIAWDNYKGLNQVVVAVLDTGINVDSAELFYRMVPEWDWKDFTDNDQNPRDIIPTITPSPSATPTPTPVPYSHGTNVAGIIGAKPDNSLGYTGAAWDENIIKMMPVRVLDTHGSGNIAAVADGVRWAVDHGAMVINMSLGASASYNSTVFNEAVAYARDRNVTLVCAAGNENTAVNYPARLAKSYSNVIAVGATSYENGKSWYSCYGPELSVMAPGGDNEVGSSNQQYIWNITYDKYSKKEVFNIGFCGTSQATPHVSALAAMLYSYGMTSAAEVRDIIMQTATDLGVNGRDDLYGYGLINAFAAMTRGTQADITLVTIGLRDPATKNDVTAAVHPNSSGQFVFPFVPPGQYELYGYYDLPNEYKYEAAIPVTITLTNGSLVLSTPTLTLPLLPD